MGAGILPTTIIKGKIYLLFGQNRLMNVFMLITPVNCGSSSSRAANSNAVSAGSIPNNEKAESSLDLTYSNGLECAA